MQLDEFIISVYCCVENLFHSKVRLAMVDVSHLFENDPSPSWVAATLVKITKD